MKVKASSKVRSAASSRKESQTFPRLGSESSCSIKVEGIGSETDRRAPAPTERCDEDLFRLVGNDACSFSDAFLYADCTWASSRSQYGRSMMLASLRGVLGAREVGEAGES